jgi:hypothetical protein
MDYISRDPALAKEIQEIHYRKLRLALSEGRMSAYCLTPRPSSACVLLESQIIDETVKSLTFGHDSAGEYRDCSRITTERPVDGQPDSPAVPGGFASAALEHTSVRVDGQSVPGFLYRGVADTWALTVDVGEFRVTATGNGPTGDFALHQVTDLTPAIEARIAWLEARRRERGGQQD